MNSPDIRRRPIVCEDCGDESDGPWVLLNEGRYLCESCSEKRIP